MAKIAASMARFGWTVPCKVAEDGELVAAETTWLACPGVETDPADVNIRHRALTVPHRSKGCAGRHRRELCHHQD
ncbi:MAG: hypothetical protein JJT81_03355 [Rubellimicrobium sp.]|nr:hypothetical protein [Rubellimicrobium sp.]